MRIRTKSKRLRRALRTVARQIPHDDLKAIKSFLTDVTTTREWERQGIGNTIDGISGRLLPIIPLGKLNAAAEGARIFFSLPVSRRYSDMAMAGMVAHELAHALRASKLDNRWYEKMIKNWRAEEPIANRIASEWGFTRQIKAMLRERETVLNPWIASHTDELLRRIDRREQQLGY